jgi:lipopolysaccharide/colanic/teichoic acid biosynthesis glycosyltransferase
MTNWIGNFRSVSSNGAGKADAAMLGQEEFLRMLCLERKRTERSGRHFILMLLDASKFLKRRQQNETLEQIFSALATSTRETDVKGWHTEGSIVGVIFTEIGSSNAKHVKKTLFAKVTGALSAALGAESARLTSLTFFIFPEEWDKGQPVEPQSLRLYPDLVRELERTGTSRLVKRSIDLASSLFGLMVAMPLFAIIAAAVKLTSPGPVFFRQKRLGQFGKSFCFLKFRSMYESNDPKLHQAYVQNLISGSLPNDGENKGRSVYKLTDDPRITPLGRILRRTSLDELPQLINVFLGQMSLVGPRPPIPYEFGCYALWHKRRLLAVKPGITGLWQVEGRSKVRFDDMVRLDLKYANSWSLWLDLKILCKTPRAVLTGDGAY